VGAVGEGCRPAPTLSGQGMSRRQGERASRFKAEIESSIRSVAAAFRDNDVEASVTAATRLWWTSRLRGRRFARLVNQARSVTQQRISLGVIHKGEPGRREAMPYFFAVLRDLIDRESAHAGPRSGPRSAE
jgi:hypothetical protein